VAHVLHRVLVDFNPATGVGERARTDVVGRALRRRDMQHVVRHADSLTLVVAADSLENRSLGLGVNGDEVVLVVHLDAVALGNLGALSGEKRNAENHWCVDEILEIDVGSNARAPQMVGSEINDLLRRARTLEGKWRLSEYRLASGLECLDALPGVHDMIWRIVAAHALATECLGEAIDLGPIELHPGADHQIVICDPLAGGEFDPVVRGIETACCSLDAFDARWHQAVGRPVSASEIVDPGPNQRECRLVVMRVTRLDDCDVDPARSVALQACRHGNAGGAAADDQDFMVRRSGHDGPPVELIRPLWPWAFAR
jgi:hypothetical protein